MSPVDKIGADERAAMLSVLEAALVEEPGRLDLRKQLGDLYRDLGQWGKAERCYDGLLEHLPEHRLELSLSLGAVLRQQGKIDQAITLYERAIAENPKVAELYHNLGNALNDVSRYIEAIEIFEAALALKPDYSSAYLGLGIALGKNFQKDKAFDSFKLAIRYNPENKVAYLELGKLLLEHNQPADARICFESALAIDPDYGYALEAMGCVSSDLGDYEAALGYYRQALATGGAWPTLFSNMGNCLMQLERYEDAIEALTTATDLSPTLSVAHYNLGVAYSKLNRLPESIQSYDQAIALVHHYPKAQFNQGLVYLKQGDWEQGWAGYEYRFQQDSYYEQRQFSQPQWRGQSLKGKRILIAAEQGFGDAIQYARYLPLLKAQGATVLFECPGELMTLFDQCPYIDVLVPKDAFSPHQDQTFDVFCYLMSLPYYFKTQEDTIPASENIFECSRKRQAYWQNRLSGHARKKVGIVWASKPDNPTSAYRSCRLSDFAVFRDIHQVQFYSLQKGEAALSLYSTELGFPVVDLSPDIRDFADTAAIIQNLDLVISVDTSVVHLAGTLRCPTWVLLPFQSDWRWLQNRLDSPWYPSARLFRQEVHQNWRTLFDKVHAALKVYASE